MRFGRSTSAFLEIPEEQEYEYIQIKKDGDGYYYWHITFGRFLRVEHFPIKFYQLGGNPIHQYFKLYPFSGVDS